MTTSAPAKPLGKMSFAKRHLPQTPTRNVGAFRLRPHTPNGTKRRGCDPSPLDFPPGVPHRVALSEAGSAERGAVQIRQAPYRFPPHFQARLCSSATVSVQRTRIRSGKHPQAVALRRPPQNVAGQRPFLFTGRGDFLFGKAKRKWGRIPRGETAQKTFFYKER